MRKIKQLIFSAIITLLFTKLYAAGNDVTLGGKVTGITLFGYIVIFGVLLSIVGLGVRFWLKKKA